jgi:predicted O-methyltransferase YrrM
MTLQERYDRLCATPSSINELLPVLRRYAEQCGSIAEFGVDIGQSTTAFLMAQPKRLISIDVVRKPELDELFGLLHGDSYIYKTQWFFRLLDSLMCTIPEVDMLFIDSSHCYDHIKSELERHHAQVRRWIICHDTIAYGEFGEAGPPQVGIVPAIEEFLATHPEWIEKEHLKYNNGLLVMERTDAH